MAVGRGSPMALEALTDLGGEEQLRASIEDLVLRIRAVDEQQRGWLDQQLRLEKMRYADRYPRDVPWRNASNTSVPLIDGIIRRWKPGIAALVLDAEPVAFMSPQEKTDVDAARLAEQFFDFLFRIHMNTPKEVMLLVDLIAQRGHAYAREGWRYRTARQVRIVNVADVFPGGVDVLVQAAATQQLQEGAEDPSAPQLDPVEVVMRALATEYELDPTNPVDGQMLADAATKIIAGATYVKLTYRRVVDDRPEWMALDPMNVIVPPDEDPEQARFFCVIEDMSPDDIRSRAIDGLYDAEATKRVLEKINENTEKVGGAGSSDRIRQVLRDVQNSRAGITERHGTTRNMKQLPSTSVWEVFALLDVNGDGEQERCILYYAPEFEEVLGLVEYPFPFDSWPVTLFVLSGDKRRPIDVRGIPQMLKPFQKLINAFHNARVDASTILLAPMMQMRTTGNAKRTINWRPGGVVPVQQVGDIAPISMDLRVLQGLLQEEQVNQRIAETYIGVFDATIQSLQGRERRTAREIGAITDVSSSIFGLDAKLFMLSLSRSMNKVWDMYLEFGPPEMFFRVQGEELPKLAKKAEIGRQFDLRASGTPANTNKQFVLANVEHAMQILFSSPVVLQSGLVDVGEVLKDWLKLLDFKMAGRFIRGPEQAAAVQQILQAAQISGGEGAPSPPPF
ncbi:MAG: hypothetical protein L0099_07310 [Acidobacteria bacterium]|nr:hypothetical protein [Acidobacteriota bacterium]